MAQRFTDKVVMVTGAAGNVASGVLEVFAAEGAKLGLVDLNAERTRTAAQDANLKDDQYVVVEADISEPDAVKAAIQQIQDKFGAIDILIHTAGGFGMGDPVHALNMDVYEKMMFLNARLTYVTCGAVAAHMLENNKEGAIVSILAKAGLSGAKNMGAYTASKAAAERIVQSMAKELRDKNIRVNGIMPSIVDTPPNRKDMPDANFDKWVSPKQIADTAAFLASDDASAISGASVPVYNHVL